MKRRDFIALASGATVWPAMARAQKAKPLVIGFLSVGSAVDQIKRNVDPFRRGLGESGLFDGQNAAIEFRFAEGHYDRLPALANELVALNVSAITTTDTASTLAAKNATPTIPVVFVISADPVKVGLVASLNRPGGNVTGISDLLNLLAPKLFELLHEALPGATSVGFLVNPTNPGVDSDVRAVQAAADAFGQKLVVLEASTDAGLEDAFDKAAKQRISALEVNLDLFLSSRREKIVALAARNSLPAIYSVREYAAVGGLMSYGTNVPDASYRAGGYVGRILKGEKPADLPIQQSTKVELVLNMKTANALGFTFPLTLLGRADEVIE